MAEEGRPSKYSEEMQEKAEHYLENWKTLYPEDVIPTQEALCLHLGIDISTVRDWHRGERAKEKFSSLVNDLIYKQRKLLVNNGLAGKFTPKITTLILSQKQHQIIETKHVDQTIDGSLSITQALNAAEGSGLASGKKD